MANRRILTVSELAEHLNVHRITIYRLLKNGNLPGFKIGRVWRFDLDDISGWMEGGKSPQSSASLETGDSKTARKVLDVGELDGSFDNKNQSKGRPPVANRKIRTKRGPETNVDESVTKRQSTKAVTQVSTSR